MKKYLSALFLTGVLLVCLSFGIGILFAGPSEAGANERLSNPPKLTEKDGSWNAELLPDTAAWFNDHFFGRQQWISLNNWLTAKLTGTAVADNVLLGSDGWLYYGSTVADFTDTEPLTERELYSIAQNLQLMQEACAAEGKTFAFTVAPNKNSLYPQHMPHYGVNAETTNARRLEAALGDMGVNYADLFTALGNEEEILYFAHDSHWNSKGAALGADTVNASLGRVSTYYSDPFAGSQPHAGDLYEMMYPAFADTETDPVYGGTLTFTYESNATKPDSITLLTAGAGEGSLLMYRDSFGNLLYPYLSDSFAACRFSRSTTYDLTLDADYVVVEIVERNLRYLIANQSVYMAPQRQLELPAGEGTVDVEISTPKQPENALLVTGTLPQNPDANSPVYIVCANGVYEASLLEDNGFGAYLSGDTQIVGVAYYAGGALQLPLVP